MRSLISSLFILGLVASSAAAGCGSSQATRPDPSAEQRQNDRIRADADAEHKALNKEEDKRDESQQP